ncbi:uncharacterized protein EI90DRAFT_2506701 [Cantharellus anzutake]|uniref:uncharacterized protein n=1 Tax=Cantharellus anzutake TaxID=1750568 RepID=UPI0019064FB0|nr:uncharacterized protein EI90DRAFT_2506701 [Cantharellus anzutake]KAF8321384.1 hypothetical protein EI90DRAFT_2506701 [Cantharellus anzutake]
MQFSFQKLRETALFRGLGDIHPFQTLGDVLPFRKLVDVPFFRRLGDLFSFQQLKDMPSFRKLGDIFPFQKLKDIPYFRKLGDIFSFRKLRNILSSLKDTISKSLLQKNDHFLGNNLLLISCILFPVALSTITYKVSMHPVVSHYFRYGSVTAGTARGSVARRMAFVRRSENYGSDSEGNPFDDFIMLDGQFDPDRPISDLTLYHGRVIEGLTVTYNLRDGTTRTSIHGTPNRDHLNNFTYLELSDKEIVNSITGKVGVRGSSEKSSIVRLAFEVRNTATGNIRFLGPFGDTRDDGQGQDFAVPGPIFAFAGRDFGDQAG